MEPSTMRIAVCVKQVPDSGTVSLDPETHTLVRASVGVALNPLDEFPLEIALRLKDATGAELVAFTMGPPRAEEVLARTVAMGADKGILLSDPKFAGGDTWATSLTLAEALKRHGPFDIALFGKQAIDGDTAQVGPETATHLGWAQAACVSDVAMPEGGKPKSLRVKRLFEDFSDEVEIALPCVLTVLKEAAEPRFGTLEGRLNYFKTGVEKKGAADLDVKPEKLGLKGSPTRVVKTSIPSSTRDLRKLEGTIEHQVTELADILKEKLKA
jgi:electron transfer flavoprotein beta subunit